MNRWQYFLHAKGVSKVLAAYLRVYLLYRTGCAALSHADETRHMLATSFRRLIRDAISRAIFNREIIHYVSS